MSTWASPSFGAKAWCVATLALALLACGQKTATGAPSEPQLPESVARYYRVAEIVFRYEPFDFRRLEYRLVLRFVPAISFPPESQIIISKRIDGTYQVKSFELAEQGKHLSTQIDDVMDQTGVRDAEQLATQIKVKVREVDLSRERIEDLVRQYAELRPALFFETGVSPSGNPIVELDPTTYMLWFETAAENNLSVEVRGPNYGQDKRAHPLIRWMNRVRAAVEERK